MSILICLVSHFVVHFNSKTFMLTPHASILAEWQSYYQTKFTNTNTITWDIFWHSIISHSPLSCNFPPQLAPLVLTPTTSCTLSGTLLLQIVDMVQVTMGSEEKKEGYGVWGWKIACTDGYEILMGFLMCKNLVQSMKKGMKIIVHDVSIRKGIMWLNESNCTVWKGSYLLEEEKEEEGQSAGMAGRTPLQEQNLNIQSAASSNALGMNQAVSRAHPVPTGINQSMSRALPAPPGMNQTVSRALPVAPGMNQPVSRALPATHGMNQPATARMTRPIFPSTRTKEPVAPIMSRPVAPSFSKRNEPNLPLVPNNVSERKRHHEVEDAASLLQQQHHRRTEPPLSATSFFSDDEEGVISCTHPSVRHLFEEEDETVDLTEEDSPNDIVPPLAEIQYLSGISKDIWTSKTASLYLIKGWIQRVLNFQFKKEYSLRVQIEDGTAVLPVLVHPEVLLFKTMNWF